ncbi:PKD domain-containing protein [Patescibacteria group bacterium]
MAILRKIKKHFGLLFVTALLLSVFVVPQTASADLCDQLADKTGGFFSCGEGETSFTQFQGGLTPPSTEGYDPSLVQETNLRDYIVNIVNFVLGFLGLVAMVIVIYGGFLYVTAAGAEEQTTKGKKSIMYAVIGIVIILISFALVNTLIGGLGKGTDAGVGTGQLSGSAPDQLTGDQTQNVQRLFFLASSQVERAAKDLATTYSHYIDVDDTLADLTSVPPADTQQQVTIFLNDMKRALRNVVSSAGDLSRSAEQAKMAEDQVDIWLRATEAQLARETESDIGDVDYWKFWQADPQLADFQGAIMSLTVGLEDANLLDFHDAVSDIKFELEDLKIQLENSGFVDTQGTDFELFYDDAIESLDALLIGAPDNILIVDALTALSDLHTVVQNIQFVAAIITADVDDGNGPLIVNFDALRSVRPDYQTINEDDIYWDFGDGSVAEGRFAVSHVYRKTGTYVVKMTIDGDAANNIAAGVAFKDVVVRPPASQINLKVNIGDRDLGYLSQYKDGFLTTDRNRFNVTLTEARDIGIIFDASESRGGFQSEQQQEAGETYIQTIAWDFGDGTDSIMGEMVAEDVQTHYYGEQGTYPVVVEVTDSRGIRDRKVFEVVVDSPAARIYVQPGAKAKINEQISFDAGNSASDGGQIVGYDWQIINTPLHYTADQSEESFNETFENPGVYNVSLTVTDNVGDSATDTTNLLIESKAPEAKFTYNIPDDSKPHIYELDGTKSFDPDGNINEGTYTYKWTVAAIDPDYDFVDENGAIDEQGHLKNRTYIKFYKIGEYPITLDVNDFNEPENPGVPESQTINVNSILDIMFNETDVTSAILNNNSEAEVTLTGISENGVAYEWDFGDNTSTTTGDIIAGQTTATHKYTSSGTYDVRLTVFDKEDNENTVKRRVMIGEADSPLAVISIKVDGEELFDLSEGVTVNRKSVIEFSADKALNRDGTGRRLGYQWDFGDTQRSTQKIITHKYSDLSPTEPGYYTATLKVVDKNDLTRTSSTTINVNVIGELPTLQAFTAVPQQTDLTTPVKVKLEAIGASDPDGQIVKYLWWYYDARDPQLTMGHTITQTPSASVTIGTRGVEGEEMTYKFGLQMTDQENFDVDVMDVLDEGMIPSLDVVNGPNDIPVSKFNVDRTSIMIGETINFTSSSSDPDGRIVQYIWDFEGDGFGNNKATSLSTISHTYDTPAIDGVNVRLKVVDDNFAESISLPVKVFVDTDAEAPVAAFKTEQTGKNTMHFINNSAADVENGAVLAKYTWDFDVSSELDSADSDGDGVRDNDTDSADFEPTFTYDEDGIYRAKLTIEDNFGNTSEVINFVNVKPAAGTITTTEEDLKANFVSTPKVSPEDNSIHLSGDFDEVSFDFTKSTGSVIRYVFDDNVYVDSNDNGRKADDEDYVSTKPGVYTTTFNSETDRIKIRLTVYDDEGRVDIKEIRIVFDEDESDLGANVLGGIHQSAIPAIVVSIVLFAIVSLSLYMHVLRYEPVRINSKKRKK